MKARVHKVYHTPGFDTVTIVFEALDGPFQGKVFDRYTKQSEIALKPGADAWAGGDEQLLAVAQTILEAEGAELDLETKEIRVDKAPVTAPPPG